jgi:hypothetical protein
MIFNNNEINILLASKSSVLLNIVILVSLPAAAGTLQII